MTQGLRAPDDKPAFTLYREVKALPWWRFWLTGREKEAAREMYRRVTASGTQPGDLVR